MIKPRQILMRFMGENFGLGIGANLMLDHVSISVSDIAAAERFYDAIMKALGVVKVGRRDDWLGYGERARPAYPDRVYLTIRRGPKPEDAFGRHWCFKARWQTQVDAFWDAG